MRILVCLLLVGCVDKSITPDDWEHAERMCAGQKGIATVHMGDRWMNVECKNGMEFAKKRKDDDYQPPEN